MAEPKKDVSIGHNVLVAMDGDDIILRINTAKTYKQVGSPTAGSNGRPGKPRMNHLVASTGTMKWINTDLAISLNVFRRPNEDEAAYLAEKLEEFGKPQPVG